VKPLPAAAVPRPPLRSVAALLVASLFALASTSSAGDAPTSGTSRVYVDVSALAALVEGLGYEPQIAGEVVSFRVTRGQEPLSIEVRLLLSPGAFDTRKGVMLQLFSPLYHWEDFAGVSAARLSAMLEKSLEIAPSRFYVLEDEKKVSAWVGLQRSVDNRAVRPIDVRRQIEGLFDDVRATQPLWDAKAWK
jgi:hypothetical protein